MAYLIVGFDIELDLLAGESSYSVVVSDSTYAFLRTIASHWNNAVLDLHVD